MYRFLCAIVLSAASLVAAEPAADWWKHVVYLSDDSFNGRAAGTPEHRKAAEYVARQLEYLGLTPGAGRDYLQPVPLQSVTVDRAKSRIVLVSDGSELPLAIGTDVIVNARGVCGNVDAPLAFVGHGLSLPELGHDDLAGVDLKGKIAVFTAGAPDSLRGPLVSHRQGGGERWRVLHERGAVGAIVLHNPNQPAAPRWEDIVARGAEPTSGLARGDEYGERRLALTARPDLEARLKSAGARVKASLHCSARPQSSENVVAILEGGDPALRHEYVVLSAHLDHIGAFGTGGDTIYNGAMDNAAGVASLIDAAARLRASGAKLRRPVAFLAVTAEEKGLLGSEYFARNPSLPRGARMVANINMDMFLPVIPMKALIGWGMEESSLEEDVHAAARSVRLEAERDPVPQMNPFIRSDQYSFVRAGVPSVMVAVGAAGDKETWKTWETWMETRYHRPNDDAAQPVNRESAETFQRALVALVTRVANADRAPRWNADSVFNPSTRASSARRPAP